ncbi:MAG: DinB family protein [Flammeovirgaceae bacterium]
MQSTIQDLATVVSEFTTRISQLPESDFTAKPQLHKWSKKEVLGHLIDSAENNLRRFICGQYEVPAPNIKYTQDFWVKANQYQNTPSNEVIENWQLINRKICRVLQQMPRENYGKVCDFGDGHFLTLEWLAADYVKHLKHHLNQIIPQSFDIAYP